MLLASISIENYSIHRATDVALSPVTVFVGRNGGGKSALLDALMTLGRTARGSLAQAFEETGAFSYRARLFHGVPDDAEMRFVVRFEPGDDYGVVEYELSFGPSQDRSLCVSVERLTTQDGRVVLDRGGSGIAPSGLDDLHADTTALATMRHRRSWIDDPDLLLIQRCAHALGRMLRFRFDAYAIATDSPDLDLPEDEREVPKEPGIGVRGENTGSFLYWLRDYRGPDLRALETEVAEVIPGFVRFSFTTARPGRIGFSMQFDDDRGTVDSRNLSSGTLTVVGLIALTHFIGSRRPKVLCVEEPELGLTPMSARGVFSRFHDRPRDAQFLITSHSPHILCAALNNPDTAVLRAVPDEQGIARVVSVRDAALDELGVPGPMMLGQGGGVGVETALRLMEGLG